MILKCFPLISFISCATLIFSSPCLGQFSPDRPTFFQDGQRLMEQEIRRLQQQQNTAQQNQQQVEHPSQLLTIDDGQLRWQKYLFRDGGFSVWMPQGIQSNEIVTLETKAGSVDFEVFATHPKSLRFIAAYSEDKDLSELGNNQEILKAIKNGIITKTNFELKQEKPITFDSIPGLLLEMQDGQETIFFQIYLVDQKIYVLAVGNKNGGYEEEIMGFFDSFRLLN
jgi:hypothetical protein